VDFSLILVAAEGNYWLQLSSWWAIAQVILGLGFVIFVHELGHFLVAKACGVKCEKFYVGFDVPISIGPIKLPAALWKKQWGETEYGIGIVPLGGYVKMLGQHDNPQLAAAEAEKARIQSENPDSTGEKMDPRSYPAKTVLQRMAIISAGVIFNLIFGCLFAAAAYMLGVNYMPTEIGSTVPGDSAWRAGLKPGDQLVQFHRDGKRDDKLSFSDLRFNVTWMGDKKPLEVLVKDPAGEEHWLALQAKTRDDYNAGMPTIGVTSAHSLDVAKSKYDTHTSCGKSDLQMHDEVLAIIIDGKREEIADAYRLQQLLYTNSQKPLQLVVKRFPLDAEDNKREDETPTEETVTLPPQPLLELGMTMKMGPIVALQTGSPVEKAGFEIGDVLKSIDGELIVDPMLVDRVLLEKVGQPVVFTVERGDGTSDITVTPRPIEMLGNQTHITRRPDSPISAETLGLAFSVNDEIASVVSGGPAAAAGLQAGDAILNVSFVRPEGSPVDKKQFKRLGLGEPIEFTRETNEWTFLDKVMQTVVPEGVDLKVTYERDGKAKSVDLTPVASTENFNMTRGLAFLPPVQIRKATSIGEAFELGWKEIKYGVLQIFTVLGKIGKSYKHLGGPISIAAVATSAASDGIPTLLLFLTLLSANLAVLNFLPIPVLDGGHIMFLLYEGIFGKPMNERIAFFATMVGLSMILTLMLFAIGMDITRIPQFFAE